MPGYLSAKPVASVAKLLNAPSDIIP